MVSANPQIISIWALIAGDYLQLIAVAGAIQEGFERHKKKQIQQRGEKTTLEQRQQNFGLRSALQLHLQLVLVVVIDVVVVREECHVKIRLLIY